MLKNIFVLRKKEYLYLSLVLILMLIFGVILEYALDEDFACGIATVTGGTMFNVFYGLTHPALFNNMIQYGRTRKEYFIGNLVSSIARNLIVVSVALIFKFITEAGGNSFALNDALPLYIAVLVLVSVVLEITIGTLILRLSQKGFWIMWCIWMLLCYIPQMIARAMNNAPDSFFGKIGIKIANATVNFNAKDVASVIVFIALFIFILDLVSTLNQDVK